MAKNKVDFTFLAVDPGFDRLGWAIAISHRPHLRILDFGCLQTNQAESKIARLLDLYLSLQHLVSIHQPRQLALESLYFNANKTTALQVSEARGLVIAACLKPNLQLFEYNPTTIKKVVTGYGRADKTAVAAMLKIQLKLPKPFPKQDDTVDALAIAFTHSLMVEQKGL